MGIIDKIFKPNIEKLKENEDVDGLINALKHKNVDIREKAVKALGGIGEPTVEPLIWALKNEDWHVRAAAVEALGKIGDVRAVEPLLILAMGVYTSVNEALEKEEDYLYGVNKKAKEAFIEIWEGSAVEQFIQVLKDIDPGVRELAALALGEIGDVRAVTPLITALKDTNGYVREATSDSLEKIGEATNKYFCYLCGKELKGKDWEFVKKREKDSESFISDVYRPGVPSKIRDVWELKNRIFYCKDCILESENWMEKDKVCINCSFFMMNFVQLPNISDFYCRVNEEKVISDPLKDTCKKWELAKFFISE